MKIWLFKLDVTQKDVLRLFITKQFCLKGNISITVTQRLAGKNKKTISCLKGRTSIQLGSRDFQPEKF